MNYTFLKQLSELSDSDFVTLEYHIHIARGVRTLVFVDCVPEEVICKQLEVSTEQLQNIMKGAHPFDLKFLSKLNVLQEKVCHVKAKNAAESKGIKFSAYKYSQHD